MVAAGQPILEEQGVEAGELEGARGPLAPVPRGPHLARGQHHDSGGNAKGESESESERALTTKLINNVVTEI